MNLNHIELWTLLFASLFGAIWGTYVTAHHLWGIIRVRKWQCTDGSLESVDTREVMAVGDPSAAMPDRGPLNIFVKYRYVIGGTPLCGTQFSVLDSALPFTINQDKKRLDKLKIALSSDRQVEVWFNPTNPKQSVLTRNPYIGLLTVNIGIFVGSWFGVFKLFPSFGAVTLVASVLAAYGLGKLFSYINPRPKR